MRSFSPLQRERLDYQPKLPNILLNIREAVFENGDILSPAGEAGARLEEIFQNTSQQPIMYLTRNEAKSHRALKVGVVFSGGQAAGGHNVVIGIYDSLKKLNADSKLFGFLQGPKGIVDNRYIEITNELTDVYRNQGGFDMLGSGRDKIETPEQYLGVKKTVTELGLDGLVVIGGDDSNTNAAFLAEYFVVNDIPVTVVGVPKTIDGDLKNKYIEISFGFDSACKVYSETIGNILRDALSAGKYYFFIKIMGRSASHIALECALETRPNMTLISEEILSENKTLRMLTNEIADMICLRASSGKDFGVVVIPEGVIEFIPEFKVLISEMNGLLAAKPEGEESQSYVEAHLSEASKQCFSMLPNEIKSQLLLDRDPHGNVNVSKIESERLFIELVKVELKRRKAQGSYKGKFSPQPLFLGYEGRSCLPSNFDAQYCYALGFTATLLVNEGATSYMATICHLARPVEEWQVGGIPLVPMMDIEMRKGMPKPVIKKALVEQDGKPFTVFKNLRDSWAVDDKYLYPGPMQFFGPDTLTERYTLTLLYESEVPSHK